MAIVYFEQYLSTVVPHSSLGIPLIIILMNNVSVMVTVALLGNIYVLNLHHREPDTNNDMNKWVINTTTHNWTDFKKIIYFFYLSFY